VTCLEMEEPSVGIALGEKQVPRPLTGNGTR
jgi:hypothetical protein